MSCIGSAGAASIRNLGINNIAFTTNAVVGVVPGILDFHLAAAQKLLAVFVVTVLSDTDNAVGILVLVST